MYHILNLFSENQAITTTAASTNVIDTGAANLGDVNQISLEIDVPVAFAGGTSLSVALQHSDDDTAGNFTDALRTAVIVTADLTAGKRIFKCALPYGLKRFLRLNYTVVGPMTAGQVTAKLVDQER